MKTQEKLILNNYAYIIFTVHICCRPGRLLCSRRRICRLWFQSLWCPDLRYHRTGHMWRCSPVPILLWHIFWYCLRLWQGLSLRFWLCLRGYGAYRRPLLRHQRYHFGVILWTIFLASSFRLKADVMESVSAESALSVPFSANSCRISYVFSSVSELATTSCTLLKSK